MAIKIGIAFLVLVAAALVFIGTRPESFRVERSGLVDAPADAVFPLINDFHQWVRWSPYDKMDPDMKKSYDGPPAGPGAGYAWSGNSSAGEGRITILESKPDEFILMKLEFTKPFACTNQVRFTLAPSRDGTRVTWCMDGTNNFMGKAFSLAMDMDKMVGKEFENGLANLNDLAKAETQRAKTTAPQGPAEAQAGEAAREATP